MVPCVGFAAINHGSTPAMTIYYQVGSPDTNQWSDVHVSGWLQGARCACVHVIFLSDLCMIRGYHNCVAVPWFPCSGQTYVTPAALGASTETFISVFGDLGVYLPFSSEVDQQAPAAQTLTWLNSIIGPRTQASNPSAVFHIGDISYARSVL